MDRKSKLLSCCLLLAAAATFSPLTPSALGISWNSSTGGNWSDANNWNPKQVPGPADAAFITNTSGTFTVTVDTNASVFNLTVGGGVGGVQTLAIASGATLSVGSILNIASNGPVTVGSNGTLNLATELNMLETVTSAGTINMSNTFVSLFNFANSPARGAFINQPGGLIDFRGDANILPAFGGGQGYFTNQGILRKSAGTGVSAIRLNVFDTTSGTVDVESGGLMLQNFNGALAGAFNAAAGSTIYLSGGTNRLVPGSRVTLDGAGQFQFTGFLYLPTDIIPGLIMTAGTLELGPDFQGGAITNLALGGIGLVGTNIISGSLFATNSNLTGNFTVTNGGTFVANGASISAATNSPSGLTVLNGGLVHTVGNGLTINQNGSTNVAASLTIASGGVMRLNDYSASLTLYGPMTNAGALSFTNTDIDVWNDGSPVYQGSILNQSNGVIASYGGGAIAGAGGHADFINQGTLENSGLTAGMEGFNLFSNEGVLHGAGGVFTFLGIAQVVLQPSSVISVDISFYGNNGTFAFGAGTGTLNLAGSLSAGLVDGFVPGYHALFSIVRYNSFSGAFSSISLPPTLSWNATYASNQFSITTLPPLTVTNLVANDKFYDGTSNATLVVTNAALVGVVSGDSVTLDASGATAFFTNQSPGYNKRVIVTGLSLAGPNAQKYFLTQPTLAASIFQLPLQVTGVIASNKVYDGTYDAAVNVGHAVISGVLPGESAQLDTNGVGAIFFDPYAGTNKLIYVYGWSLTGPDADNYTLPYQPVNADGSFLTADITPMPLTVLGITANNKIYDGTTGAALNTSGAALSGVIPFDDVTLDTNGYAAAFASPNVGMGIAVTVSGLTLAGTNSLDYTLIQPSGLTANILIGSGSITLHIAATNGNAFLRGDGAPGQTYLIQSLPALDSPAWSNLSGALQADGGGQIVFTDRSPPFLRFYRARVQP